MMLLRLVLVLALACSVLGQAKPPTQYSNLGGQVQVPDHSPVTGKFQFVISRAGVVDTCNGGAVIPTTAVYVTVQAGVVNSTTKIIPNMCFSNPAVMYTVRLMDMYGNIIWQDLWSLQALGLLDVGTLIRLNLPQGGGTYGLLGGTCNDGYGVGGMGLGGYGATCGCTGKGYGVVPYGTGGYGVKCS